MKKLGVGNPIPVLTCSMAPHDLGHLLSTNHHMCTQVGGGEGERRSCSFLEVQPFYLGPHRPSLPERRLGNVVLIVGVHVPSEKWKSAKEEALRYWQRQLAQSDRMAQPTPEIYFSFKACKQTSPYSFTLQCLLHNTFISGRILQSL